MDGVRQPHPHLATSYLKALVAQGMQHIDGYTRINMALEREFPQESLLPNGSQKI